MKHARSLVLSTFGPVVLAVLLALFALLFATNARADDYTDIAQLMRAGRLPEALARADQALATQPKDAQMRFIKGVIQRDSGKTSDAISTFIKLNEDYPDLPEPLNNLAVLYASQGQFDKARNALEMALKTNPSYAAAHENLSDVYAKLSSQAYNRALQLDTPATAPQSANLALLREFSSPAAAKYPRTIVPPPVVAVAASQPVSRPAVQIASNGMPTASGKVAPPSGANAAAVSPKLPTTTVAAAPARPTPAPAPTQPAQTTLPPQPVQTAQKPQAAPPKPAAQPPQTTQITPPPLPPPAASSTDREVEAAIKAWAAAWSARDIKSYLAAYGRDFATPAGMNRSSWEEERRKRIAGKSNISVKLSNVVISSSGNKATVRFRQEYKASGLAVSSRKQLDLSKAAGHWQIVRETVVN